MENELGFKKLQVWHEAIDFASEVMDICELLQQKKKHYRLLDQVEGSAASVSANIAEGRGRNTEKEFRQFLCIARGSLYETLSFLYLFYRSRMP